jgi:uncharacterized protein
MDRRKITIEAGIEVSSVWAIPDHCAAQLAPTLILAHGAGSDMEHAFLSFVHEALARHGIASVKFNFPYTEARRKVPDAPERLARTWRAVIERVRAELSPQTLFLGGKSMGGRIASQVVAAGERARGLVFLGYPLHPAGRPEALRVKHLAGIDCPMLFIQGSRDRLCDLGVLERELPQLSASVTLHVIEEGDHSFKVPKRTGRSEQQIWDEIVETTAAWLLGRTNEKSS